MGVKKKEERKEIEQMVSCVKANKPVGSFGSRFTFLKNSAPLLSFFSVRPSCQNSCILKAE